MKAKTFLATTAPPKMMVWGLRTHWPGLLPLRLVLSLPAVGQIQFTDATNNGTIALTKYTGPGGDVAIPPTIAGLPVTSIQDEAFQGCTNLTSITIPPGITHMGYAALRFCIGLKSVTIPASLTHGRPGILSAERAPQSPAELLEEANLVVAGRVVDIQIFTERAHIEKGFGNYDWAIDLTLQVTNVEKGHFAGDNLVARCFRIKSRKSVVEYTPSGNHPVPSVGTPVRAHLYRRNNHWRVIYPNGLTPLLQGVVLANAEVPGGWNESI